MFTKNFTFTKNDLKDTILITPDILYNEDTGYGFFTEEARRGHELLNIPELNTGFDVWYWDQGKNLTLIKEDTYGCYVDSEEEIPLSFKVKVPSFGNYSVTFHLVAAEDTEYGIIFTGRRRFALKKNNLKKGETITFTTNVNVTDIIPRGKSTRYTDLTLDISIIGKYIRLADLSICENSAPTIFLAGDSTVTDQVGHYPYNPGASYSGWGQALSAFVTSQIAIANHAHSGLTTESFRSEGHYDILMDSIKPGDYCMFQFAHNDQKLSHLKAREGYRDNLITYTNEIRQKGATPILVTPICRNTWKGNDGTYNDLLTEYADAVRELGQEMKVLVADLHKKSYDFITSLGLEPAKLYFYPGDYTHTNDYGAFLMAYFVALELSQQYDFITLDHYSNWLPPKEITVPQPPKDAVHEKESAQAAINFTDINESPYKKEIETLTSLGIIPNTEETFRPKDAITRVEALNFTIKLYGFFATNVYNDMFTDVVGHEWYAGVVECACSNGIFNMDLAKNKLFKPHNTVTYKELYGYCVNGYQSRKTALKQEVGQDLALDMEHSMTREEAAALLYRFKEIY